MRLLTDNAPFASGRDFVRAGGDRDPVAPIPEFNGTLSLAYRPI